MIRTTRARLALGAGTLAATLFASGSAMGAMGMPTTKKTTKTVTLRFVAVAGTTPVSCGTLTPGLGTGAAPAQIQDLRFYISNVKLIAMNGRQVPLHLTGSRNFNLTKGGNAVTLIDMENGKGSCTEGDAATNTVIRGTVPAGTYMGARFYVGVPFPLNHTDTVTAKPPLDLAAMGWAWQAGRKFMKVEVTDPGGAAGTWPAKTFMVHLGSTGCVGNPASGQTVNCAAGNRASVHLMSFNPAKQRIAFDLKALLAGNDVTRNTAATAPGCMSGPTDPECAGVFGALDVNWKADGTGTGVSGPGHDQTVFRAIN